MQFGQTDLGRMVLWLLRSQSSASQTPTAFGQNQKLKHMPPLHGFETKTHAAFARI
jgi:hypothetical protein